MLIGQAFMRETSLWDDISVLWGLGTKWRHVKSMNACACWGCQVFCNHYDRTVTEAPLRQVNNPCSLGMVATGEVGL